MDTNKMRAEFEAAYEAESTKRNGRFYPAALTRGDDGDYVIPSVQSAWWGWQASREAVVVEIYRDAVEDQGRKIIKIPMWYWCWVLFAGFVIGSIAGWHVTEKPERICAILEMKP